MHADGVGLEDEDAVVVVADEAREEVAFGMDEAEDVGVGVVEKAYTPAVVEGVLKSLEPEAVVNFMVFER